MNIFVCLKQTAARDSALRVASSGDWVDDSDLSHEMNEPDAFALEEALRLKEQHGGEVVAISAGPARAASTIRVTSASLPTSPSTVIARPPARTIAVTDSSIAR